MRYVRDSIGVDTVIVNGAVSYRDGRYTDAHAGSVCS
jgi:hypothetical protein